MQKDRTISFRIRGKDVEIDAGSIIYAIKDHGVVEIHMLNGEVLEVNMTIGKIEEMLGDGFVRIQRSCIAAARAIHDINTRVEMVNGECLPYSKENLPLVLEELRQKRQKIIDGFVREGIPSTQEEYENYYNGMGHMPFAFTDIEMVFSSDSHAIDWIFRYGNQPLAKLEKVTLKRLIGNTFSSIFPNMDQKWLKAYERAVLYGETLEFIDFSPEIDKTIKVVCFPTFSGHCGCILFDLSEIKLMKISPDSEPALLYYLGAITGSNRQP